jgi:hypothetical protein
VTLGPQNRGGIEWGREGSSLVEGKGGAGSILAATMGESDEGCRG